MLWLPHDRMRMMSEPCQASLSGVWEKPAADERVGCRSLHHNPNSTPSEKLKLAALNVPADHVVFHVLNEFDGLIEVRINRSPQSKT